MQILLFIAKAAGLIVLAGLFFLGIQEALDTRIIGASQQGLCAGTPITGCFLTII